MNKLLKLKQITQRHTLAVLSFFSPPKLIKTNLSVDFIFSSGLQFDEELQSAFCFYCKYGVKFVLFLFLLSLLNEIWQFSGTLVTNSWLKYDSCN
ncbi:hypothetical protein PTUN_b0924 [Pseudoalteromonas tunicata]|uniref:Uncharacterized protein n=1 Tax=Pseudoalteromonas tunicata D2 TaxID=87626 RepID=A4C3Z4_9GAMM|nr:hypothetical protein PTUN_b0924 [Pseudoalteromonas tunicata]EAR30276.1 hypothetical protein PTD2_01866 [Pseudoalteromonas tunicata D2]